MTLTCDLYIRLTTECSSHWVDEENICTKILQNSIIHYKVFELTRFDRNLDLDIRMSWLAVEFFISGRQEEYLYQASSQNSIIHYKVLELTRFNCNLDL